MSSGSRRFFGDDFVVTFPGGVAFTLVGDRDFFGDRGDLGDRGDSTLPSELILMTCRLG